MCTTLLCLLPIVTNCVIMLNHNHFLESNWHILTFLHSILLWQIAYKTYFKFYSLSEITSVNQYMNIFHLMLLFITVKCFKHNRLQNGMFYKKMDFSHKQYGLVNLLDCSKKLNSY